MQTDDEEDETERGCMGEKKNSKMIAGFLNLVERVGNLLPEPATLFALLALIAVLASGVASWLNVAVAHPGTGETVTPVNLLSVAGMHRMLTEMVTNFTSFAPLGTVLVAMLGIGVAEASGLLGAALKLLVISAPRRLLTFFIVLAGILSNTAAEIGYVLLVPLSALVFLSVKRHPLAGMAAAFAGVSAGYSANFFLGTIDPLLAGLSEESARIIDPSYLVNPACNYFFMAASTIFLALAGTWVTERLVAPRLGTYRGEATQDQDDDMKRLTAEEKRGLKFATVALVLSTAILLWGTVPEAGFLRDPQTGSLLRSPFMSGIVALIFILGALIGIAYGVGAGTVRRDKDVVMGMTKSMETLAIYLVLVFFAAQFVAYFKWSNLGLILAIEGAAVLKAMNLGVIPLMLCFILVSAALNMFMGSASAKWAILAPVFVPMFMLLGYSPEFTQLAYRIGDSVTNIISPMMSYFALIVAFFQRYQKDAGIGTIVATMLPYSLVFLIVWSLLLVIWVVLGIPVGPGAEIFLPPAS